MSDLVAREESARRWRGIWATVIVLTVVFAYIEYSEWRDQRRHFGEFIEFCMEVHALDQTECELALEDRGALCYADSHPRFEGKRGEERDDTVWIQRSAFYECVLVDLVNPA